MIPSQMLKGTLEGCVLAIIGMKETYGYEISEQLEAHGFGRVAEGTIYPLLLRLGKGGLISATYKASELGPKRKYYVLTEKGGLALEEFIASYAELTSAVEHLLRAVKGGESDEQESETAAAGE